MSTEGLAPFASRNRSAAASLALRAANPEWVIFESRQEASMANVLRRRKRSGQGIAFTPS